MRPFPVRPRLRGAALMFTAAMLASGASAQVAAPGDVYYSAHVTQRFKYYVFANDYVQWADTTVTGTSLLHGATHDSVTAGGTVSTATSLEADAGHFQVDFDSEMWLDARTGIFHQTYNDLVLDTYVRGPTGTLYSVTIDTDGLLVASREGGLPGSLQPVNGVSTGTFEDSTLTVANGGTQSLPLDSFESYSGTTTTQIVVDGEVYSLAFSRVFTTFTSITQALCILGCMTQEANFHALSSGTVTVNIYPYADLTDARNLRRDTTSLRLAAWPNPAVGATTVSFEAPAGSRAIVDVFNTSGQRVARLFDSISRQGLETLRWNTARVPSGVYFLRAEAGEETKTTKLTVVK